MQQAQHTQHGITGQAFWRPVAETMNEKRKNPANWLEKLQAYIDMPDTFQFVSHLPLETVLHRIKLLAHEREKCDVEIMEVPEIGKFHFHIQFYQRARSNFTPAAKLTGEAWAENGQTCIAGKIDTNTRAESWFLVLGVGLAGLFGMGSVHVIFGPISWLAMALMLPGIRQKYREDQEDVLSVVYNTLDHEPIT